MLSPLIPSLPSFLNTTFDDSTRWFALIVRQTSLRLTQHMLDHAGIEYFAPCTFEQRRWSDRWKTVEVPLFPGYIFCRFQPSRRLPILQMPGVIDVVRAGRELAEVDPRELNAIAVALLSRLPMTTVSQPQAGDKVTIRSGPLKGLTGLLVRGESKDRLLLSLSLLNRCISVLLPASDVAAIAS